MAHWLVTGCNRGIGLEMCHQLADRGERVIAVCRSSSAELEGLGVRVESGIELSDEACIGELVQRLEGLELAGVILNAGILEADGLEHISANSVRRQFEVNALAPLLMSKALLGNLRSGSKLALITSRMRSIDDNRGSRLPLSISDKCCGDMPTLADNISSVRRRWLRWRRRKAGIKLSKGEA
jgi:NAD(P)-dependent dehydrogenase (short-subunit alcohol dehydrogenase family)